MPDDVDLMEHVEQTVQQVHRLREVEWDLLLVLDACRFDIWADMIGEGSPVWSAGSCSRDWIRAMHQHFDLSDTVCVTANPEVTRWSADFLYHERDDLWERKWQYVNGVGTVTPEDVTKAVEAKLVVGPDRPVYAHYVQPHGPYPKVDPPIPVMRNNPEANEVHTDVEDHPDEVVMNPTDLLDDPDSWLTVEDLIAGYRANLEWVWEAIQPLLERDLTVVVTSDHGEILGEERDLGNGITTRYGHPCRSDGPLVRLVPWVVYD